MVSIEDIVPRDDIIFSGAVDDESDLPAKVCEFLVDAFERHCGV